MSQNCSARSNSGNRIAKPIIHDNELVTTALLLRRWIGLGIMAILEKRSYRILKQKRFNNLGFSLDFTVNWDFEFEIGCCGHRLLVANITLTVFYEIHVTLYQGN